MFESHGHINVYTPQDRGRQTPGVKLIFINIKFKSSVNLVICTKLFFLFLVTDFVAVFPNQTHRRPCREIGQGQPRVIIYTHIVELESPMLHAKFQDHRTSGSGHTWAWRQFGHVTWTVYINWFPLPMEAPHKIWLRMVKRFLRISLTKVDDTDR